VLLLRLLPWQQGLPLRLVTALALVVLLKLALLA